MHVVTPVGRSVGTGRVIFATGAGITERVTFAATQTPLRAIRRGVTAAEVTTTKGEVVEAEEGAIRTAGGDGVVAALRAAEAHKKGSTTAVNARNSRATLNRAATQITGEAGARVRRRAAEELNLERMNAEVRRRSRATPNRAVRRPARPADLRSPIRLTALLA